jgi:hypothetical protein
MTRYEDLSRKINLLDDMVSTCYLHGSYDMAMIWKKHRDALKIKRREMSIGEAEKVVFRSNLG